MTGPKLGRPSENVKFVKGDRRLSREDTQALDQKTMSLQKYFVKRVIY